MLETPFPSPFHALRHALLPIRQILVCVCVGGLRNIGCCCSATQSTRVKVIVAYYFLFSFLPISFAPPNIDVATLKRRSPERGDKDDVRYVVN